MLQKIATLTLLQKVFKYFPAQLRLYFYWKIRALTYGKRSVLNLAHDEGDYDIVTQFQKNEIFPFLKKHLHGNEKLCLDFGCGPGRFTMDLAHLINGKTIGVDPIRELIKLAPKSDNVEYKLIKNGQIPLSDRIVDIIWCCLVLGGITDDLIKNTVREMMRVLNNDGLLILIENTSSNVSVDHWTFRSTESYCSMFFDVNLVPVHRYEDCGDTISILIGRKKVINSNDTSD